MVMVRPNANERQLVPPHFYMPEAGEVLYHYTSFTAALAILASDCIWMSDFAKMNDQGEYQYARSCYLEAYRNREIHMDINARLAATVALIGLERSTKMSIACLSPNDVDPHQWENYGDHRAGCAIGIDAEHLRDWAGVSIRRVVYSRTDFDAFVYAGLSMLQDQFEENPLDREEINYLARSFVSDLFAFKHANYELEREIRISRMLIRDQQNGECFEVGGHQCDGTKLAPLRIKSREGLAGPTDYIALPLSSGGRHGIRSITLGSAISNRESAIEQIREAAKFDIAIRA